MSSSQVRQRVAIAVLAIVSLALTLSLAIASTHDDFDVFRAGGQALVDGTSLYDIHIGPLQTPFIYPPFAALVFVPFALLPAGASWIAWATLSVAATLGICRVVAVRMPELSGGAIRLDPWLLTWILYALMVLSQPFIENIRLGQVNAFVMLAVLVDTVWVSRWTGLLTGVATGFKVIPGIFIVFMLVTRRWADAARAAGAFAITLIIGTLFGFAQQKQFWTEYLFGVGDQVGSYRFQNVSLYADLLRFYSRADTPTLVTWAVGSAALMICGMWVAALWWRRSRLVSAFVVGLTGVIISPIAWDHHWLWLLPFAALLFALWMRARQQGDRRAVILLAVGSVAALAVPLANLYEVTYPMQGSLAANMLISLYVLTALHSFLALALTRRLVPANEAPV